MSEHIITSSEVMIKTATIQVKALTLNNRQMTLSVFRQLPRQHIIDLDFDWNLHLKGTPWGIVNYFWDGCGYSVHGRPDEHLHVVWEYGGRLWRACVGTVLVKPDRHGSCYFCGDPEGVNAVAEYACQFVKEPPNVGCGGEWECPCWSDDSANDHRGNANRWNEFYDQLSRLDQLFIAI